ncbi:MAG: hypothetical protein BGN86_12000 [Caulobacterales bacterium 68-7]|nr:MAG: hypothetical protein BGN86_12000 [Caulobacterales bacterium 68-7]
MHKNRLRLFAAVAGALPLLVGAPAALAQTAPKACVPIPVDKIGIQLYSLNAVFAGTTPAPRPPSTPESMRNGGAPPAAAAPATPRPPPPPADPARVDQVLARVSAIGYRNAEGAGTAGLPVAQWGQLLEKNKLKLISNHGQLNPTTWDQQLADAVTTKMGPYIGSGNYGNPGLNSLEDVLATAKNLNDLGRRASAKGLRFYVHNHTREFDNKYLYDINKDGKPVMTTAWEIVAAETDPKYVNFEVDVHWALEAFKLDQPAMLAFIKKYSDRIILYHIKGTKGTELADVGGDDTDWPAVYAAGKKVEYYIWEYDGPPDGLKSAETAFNYMTCKK